MRERYLNKISNFDTARIVLFIAIQIISCIFMFWGAIPALIVFFSYLAMRKECNLKPIEKSKDYISVYMLLTAALVLFLFVYKAGMFRRGGDYFLLVFVFILLYVYHLAFHTLWLRTIDENSSIIIENGIFNFNRKNASVGFSRKDVNNIDTLLKLNEARKEGIISEDEFNKLKKRLNILND